MEEEKSERVTLTTLARSNAMKRSRQMGQYDNNIESREGLVTF